MTVLSETIRLRAPAGMVAAVEAKARLGGETVSGMIRRLLEKEVPELAPGADAEPPRAATILSDLLAGTLGAEGRLLWLVAHGSPEEKDEILLALAGYFAWDYRPPPDAANVADLIEETRRLVAGIVADGAESAH